MERKASGFGAVEFSTYSLRFKPKATKTSQHVVVNAWRDVSFYRPCHFFFSYLMGNRALTELWKSGARLKEYSELP